MKKITFFIFSLFVWTSISAQKKVFAELSENQKKEFLYSVAKDVVSALAPLYIQDNISITVSDSIMTFEFPEPIPMDFIRRYVGKKYYLVLLKTAKPDIYSEVKIWTENGEPAFLNLSRNEIGMQFLHKSFYQVKKEAKATGKYIYTEFDHVPPTN